MISNTQLLVHETSPNVFSVCEPGYTVTTVSGSYPWPVVMRWTTERLAENGLFVVDLPRSSTMAVVTSFEIARVNDVVTALPVLTPAALETLRASRISDVDTIRQSKLYGGYRYQGVRYQSRPEDWTNITTTGLEAATAVANGAKPGDMRWNNPGFDFGWIAENNSVVFMDAPTMYGLYKRGAYYANRTIMRARILKSAIIAAASYEAVAAIDINDGWPDVDATEDQYEENLKNAG